MALGTVPVLGPGSTRLAAKSKAQPKSAPAETNPAEKSAVTQALKDAYAAMPLNERLAIQSDLIWSGDYNGGVNGEFGDRAINAVKTFQKRSKGKETGILTPQERDALSAAVRSKQEQVGWKLVEDPVLAGGRLGIPAKLLPQSEQGTNGSRWSSARGEVQIETFREKMAGAQLSELFEEQKKKAKRRVEYNVLRGDFFVLSGLQGLKKFYVRVQLKDNEARGMTVLYDQAMDGIMEPVVVAMSSAFAPFNESAASRDQTQCGICDRHRDQPGRRVVTERHGDRRLSCHCGGGARPCRAAGGGQVRGPCLLRIHGGGI